MLSRGEVVILIDSSWSSWCCVFLDATPLVFLCVTCVSSVLAVAWCSSWLFSLAVFEAPSLYRAHVLSRRDRGTIVLSVFGGSVQLRRVCCSWKRGSFPRRWLDSPGDVKLSMNTTAVLHRRTL